MIGAKKHEIHLPFVPLGKRGEMTHLLVEVDYRRGDLDGVRGIVLRAGPIAYEEHSILIPLFAGVCTLVEPMTRYNAKRIAAAAARLLGDVRARRGDAWALVERALRKCARELAPMIVTLPHGTCARAVASYGEASSVVRADIEGRGWGASQWSGTGAGRVLLEGEQAAFVSYNGRVWKGTDDGQPGHEEVVDAPVAAQG